MPPVLSCKYNTHFLFILHCNTQHLIFQILNSLFLTILLFLRTYSDQLRQRLVRMSVRHHEQLFSHQQREQQLLVALQECATALEKSVQVITQINGGNAAAVPPEIAQVALKYSTKNSGSELSLISS